MIRKIVHIDEEKCNGCGSCAAACHEGAIAIVDGKAKLIRDDYCDGMGDCLPECPVGAITFEEREAAAYDEQAVAAHKYGKNVTGALPAWKQEQQRDAAHHQNGGGCPGLQLRELKPELQAAGSIAGEKPEEQAAGGSAGEKPLPQLRNWPVQIKLAPVRAPYFDGAKLLIAADCTAYAYAALHQEFMAGRVTLIGCPKLDGVDYSEKLTEIIRQNDIQSVTVVRMEVPCCGGLEMAAKKAIQMSGKVLPPQIVTISIDGKILDR